MSEIKIGDEYRHTFSYTQDQVNQFAHVTGDTNSLHIDEQYASKSIFKRRIVHGMLGTSVFTKIFGTLLYADGNIYVSQSVKFLAPMYTDKDYVALIKVKQIFPSRNRILFTTQVVDPDNDKIIIDGEALILNKLQFVWAEDA